MWAWTCDGDSCAWYMISDVLTTEDFVFGGLPALGNVAALVLVFYLVRLRIQSRYWSRYWIAGATTVTVVIGICCG